MLSYNHCLLCFAPTEAPLMSIEDMNVAGNLARPLLDNSHLKLRSHLAHGAVAKRRPPSKVSSTVSVVL